LLFNLPLTRKIIQKIEKFKITVRVLCRNHAEKHGRNSMSEEGDTFWVSLSEKFLGLLLLIIGAVTLYFTFTTTTSLGGFTGLFGFLSIVILAVGVFLLIVKPPE
jgi:hypothetical protein